MTWKILLIGGERKVRRGHGMRFKVSRVLYARDGNYSAPKNIAIVAHSIHFFNHFPTRLQSAHRRHKSSAGAFRHQICKYFNKLCVQIMHNWSTGRLFFACDFIKT